MTERRHFLITIPVSTTATDDELIAAAAATYEGANDDPSIPTVEYAVADILHGSIGPLIGPLQIDGDPPAVPTPTQERT